MMRFSAFFPLLCSFIALVLSLLCIFAGSKRGYIENADLLTLNTSMLGHSSLNTSSSSSILSSVKNDIKGKINEVATDVARQLNIHDFYSAHILNYCEGYYSPDAVANDTVQPSKNVTSCSNHTAFFHFDPTAIIQRELKSSISLSDLKWPKAIKDAIRAIETASKVMFLVYCIAVGFIGLAVIAAIVGVVAGGRISALINCMLAFLAFLALGIASAISTTIAVKVVDAINQHGNGIGLAAYQGNTFIGMTWAATILMLLAAFAWLFECFLVRRKQMTYIKDGKEGRLW